MQSMHTPGEWEVIRRGTGPLDSITIRRNYTSGSYVAEINPEATDDPHEVKANARLIAASPLMLEALRMFASAKTEADLAYSLGAAHRAIARAEGRS